MIAIITLSSALQNSLPVRPVDGEPIHWFREMVIVLFAMLALSLVLAVLTYLYFKIAKRGQAKRRKSSSRSSTGTSSDERPRRRRRRRRRSKRTNPTLADTGGLPPRRTGDPSS